MPRADNHLPRGLEPVVGLFGKGLQKGAFQLRFYARVHGGREREGPVDVGHQSRGRRVGMEGRLPEQHLEHHNPKRIQVGPVIGVGAHCLLGRHVLGGAQGLVLLREAGRRLQHSSEAEVRQYGPLVLVQEHVGGLEVPVHDALAVRVVQGVGKWVYVLQYLAELQGIAVQTVLKVASGDNLADDVREALVLAEVVYAKDVRVV